MPRDGGSLGLGQSRKTRSDLFAWFNNIGAAVTVAFVLCGLFVVFLFNGGDDWLENRQDADRNDTLAKAYGNASMVAMEWPVARVGDCRSDLVLKLYHNGSARLIGNAQTADVSHLRWIEAIDVADRRGTVLFHLGPWQSADLFRSGDGVRFIGTGRFPPNVFARIDHGTSVADCI